MEERKCKDCNYYIQHYRKSKTCYEMVFCGHCINRKPSGHNRKTDKICDYYQEKDLEKIKEERFKSATEYLSSISKKLDELNEILKNES